MSPLLVKMSIREKATLTILEYRQSSSPIPIGSVSLYSKWSLCMRTNRHSFASLTWIQQQRNSSQNLSFFSRRLHLWINLSSERYKPKMPRRWRQILPPSPVKSSCSRWDNILLTLFSAKQLWSQSIHSCYPLSIGISCGMPSWVYQFRTSVPLRIICNSLECLSRTWRWQWSGNLSLWVVCQLSSDRFNDSWKWESNKIGSCDPSSPYIPYLCDWPSHSILAEIFPRNVSNRLDYYAQRKWWLRTAAWSLGLWEISSTLLYNRYSSHWFVPRMVPWRLIIYAHPDRHSTLISIHLGWRHHCSERNCSEVIRFIDQFWLLCPTPLLFIVCW